jgi:hypothetical protein
MHRFLSIGKPDADIILSRKLAVDYIKNREAIVLYFPPSFSSKEPRLIFSFNRAVAPANNRVENQEVFKLIEEHKAGDRTIGVITKCDNIEERTENKVFANPQLSCSSQF